MCLGFWGLGFLFKGFECLWFFHFFFPFVFVLPEKNSFDGEEEEDYIEYPHRQKRDDD